MTRTPADDHHGRRWLACAGVGLGAGVARWRVRHRRSPAVASWRPGGGEHRVAGGLTVRTLGDGDAAVILLHGLTASGDYFGAGYDALAGDAQLVVPDLLGFGRSLDAPSRRDDCLHAHLAALDLMAQELRLEGRAIVVAGHSLGALLAVHWAARRSDVKRIVCFSTPLYRNAGEADGRIRMMGRVERLFGTQGAAPRILCGWMCRHRTLAEWAAVALEPRFPVTITRMAVHHSWASYAGAMNSVIRHGGWEAPLATLDAAGIPVLLADGANDPVPVPGRARELATRHHNVTIATCRGAGHQLPITHPSWCGEALLSRGLRGHHS